MPENDNQNSSQSNEESNPQDQPINWPKPNTSSDNIVTRGLNSEPVQKPIIPDNVKGS